eukprot:CAMPEP_0196663654 /NCGR_PEP_ID=MMETSP1086-20130531/53670_1 /TAXON_ID=77921 /ORGANISM="Cyanoptyche  gloeocystis , Strain SAG4.97" /LENGTH=84 /DNA_ID=CAMNT_0041999553 /DNA_START=94 /DNA_END=345 /DNA_ORIENTATION=+
MNDSVCFDGGESLPGGTKVEAPPEETVVAEVRKLNALADLEHAKAAKHDAKKHRAEHNLESARSSTGGTVENVKAAFGLSAVQR